VPRASVASIRRFVASSPSRRKNRNLGAHRRARRPGTRVAFDRSVSRRKPFGDFLPRSFARRRASRAVASPTPRADAPTARTVGRARATRALTKGPLPFLW